MNKPLFLGLFLVVFAALLVVWNWVDGSRWYTDGLLSVAGIIGPIMHGWVLEPAPDGHGTPVWVHGAEHVRAALQFDALSIGVVPVIALLAATPGIGLRRRVASMALGAVLCFLIDVLIVALFPLLVFYKNPFTDVIGTFLGLIVFVGAPVIIWFALTFRQLRLSLPSLQRRPL
jgi:hypothetical protein